MEYLKTSGINAYIPDNQFRSRDPKFINHKGKYAKKPAVTGRPWDGAKREGVIPAREFSFDAQLSLSGRKPAELSRHPMNRDGDTVAHFEGRLLQCRHCPLKARCMVNPKAADHRTGHGRQVSFVVKKSKQSTTP